MPLKILHIISGLGTGGAERMLSRLLAEGNQGQQVVCLGPSGPQADAIRKMGVEVHEAGLTFSPLAFIRFIKILKVCRRINPDLIVGWMYHGSLAATLIGKVLGRPVIWNIRHSLHSLKQEKTILRFIIRLSARISSSAKKIIYNSSVAAQQHQALGYNPQLTVILPNGIDTEDFIPDAASKASVFKELGIPENAYVIGHVARYHPMKDHLTFLKSAQLLLQSVPNAHFIMIGKEVAASNSEIMRQIKELNLETAVHLLGEKNDVQHWTAAFDVFVSSSSWGEGFSNVIAESMACGVPALATDIGDARYIIGDTGVVIPPSDEKSMSASLISLYRMGPAGRRSLGLAARNRINDHFLIKDIAQKYRQLYEVTANGHN